MERMETQDDPTDSPKNNSASKAFGKKKSLAEEIDEQLAKTQEKEKLKNIQNVMVQENLLDTEASEDVTKE